MLRVFDIYGENALIECNQCSSTNQTYILLLFVYSGKYGRSFHSQARAHSHSQCIGEIVFNISTTHKYLEKKKITKIIMFSVVI